ncbi:MAG: HAD-IIA family hydrolase [Planctomycetota bacterium]
MELRDRLRRLRHVALDLDGTLYADGVPFDCTLSFLDRLRALGIGRSFVTNNDARSTQDYVALLREIEIDADAADVHSPVHGILAWLREARPEAHRLYVLGTPELAGELMAHGYALAGEDTGDPPDAVIVGFDTGLTFERLCRAAHWIAAGRAFIATHPDRVCQTARPTVLLDCGAVCAALRAATGRGPDVVLGKPHPLFARTVMERHGVAAAELAVVGDRLYTDVAMARTAGALAVLVLSGETTAAEAAAALDGPDLIVQDVGELGEILVAARSAER